MDVTDLEALQDGLERAGSDRSRWHRWSDNGIEAVSRHFSWDAHICSYLALMQQNLEVRETARSLAAPAAVSSPLADRLLLLDLDQGLEQPENDSLVALREQLQRDARTGQPSALGIITGRSLAAARQRFAELHLPDPGVWITRAGTEIVYGQSQESDPGWSRTIAIDWNRSQVEQALEDLGAHLKLQDPVHQGPFKVSYLLRQSGEAILPLVRQRLRQRDQAARPSLRCHWFLDVMPLRASRSEPSATSPCDGVCRWTASWWWPASKGTVSWCGGYRPRWCWRSMIPASTAFAISRGCITPAVSRCPGCWRDSSTTAFSRAVDRGFSRATPAHRRRLGRPWLGRC